MFWNSVYIELCVNQIFNRLMNFVCKKMREFFYASNCVLTVNENSYMLRIFQRCEIDENSEEMLNFKRSFFFCSWFWSFFISRKRFSSSWSKSWTILLTNWWRIETRWKRSAIRSREIIAFEFVERVLFFVFFFDAFYTSTIMRCVNDFRTFRTFYTFQWLTNRIRWCDVSWRIFAYNDDSTMFLYVFVFLTIETLS
jgi:hypothetical protein